MCDVSLWFLSAAALPVFPIDSGSSRAQIVHCVPYRILFGEPSVPFRDLSLAKHSLPLALSFRDFSPSSALALTPVLIPNRHFYRMMRRLLLTLFIFGAVQAEKKDDDLQYDIDEGVVVLTDSNFDAFLKQNPSVLVKFYAPW